MDLSISFLVRSSGMVVRFLMVCLCIGVVSGFSLSPSVALASQCGPTGICPPVKVPVARPMPMMPPPGVPMMAGPGPMQCMPNCPPPCPPPACAPPACEGGFNPLSAIASVVTLPFRLIGQAVSKNRSCGPPPCPPAGCYMPMPPPCGPMPVCVPPAVKCRPAPMHAANMNMPRPMQP
jgi:hypothetical protein